MAANNPTAILDGIETRQLRDEQGREIKGALWVHRDDVAEALMKATAQLGSGTVGEPQVCDKQFHMYVWSRLPRFIAVAQAENVERAREVMLDEIETSHDGSCPEREAADKWVRENTPSIFHFRNAEFALTDSAELREQELLTETLSKQLSAARAGQSDALRETRRHIECDAILALMGKESYLAKGHVENGEYIWKVVADKISVTELRDTASPATTDGPEGGG